MNDNQAVSALVYVTFPNIESAEQVARMAVESRLAAGVNILPGVHSIYRWKGNIEETHEVAALFKTKHELFSDLCAMVASHHPYELPCIVSLPIGSGSTPFLEWIASETTRQVD